MQRTQFGDAELVNGECLAFMAGLPDNSIDAIITDPPYFKVKGEDWDNQWDKPHEFLAWVDELLVEFSRLLKPSGSLYFCASPEMAAQVELRIRERFRVLNHITWIKREPGRKSMHSGNRASKEAMRRYWPETERILFAEHYGADNCAKGEAGYMAKCDELRGFVFEPLRTYLPRSGSALG